MAAKMSRWYRLETLVHRTGKFCLLPFYHVVSNRTPAHLKALYPVRSVDQFQCDLDFFQKKFKAVSLDEILQTKTFDRPVFHLSFDDGLRETAEIVEPILKERGLTATFFLNSAFVNNRQLFFRFKASLIHQADSSRKALSLCYGDAPTLEQWSNELSISFQDYLKQQQPYLTLDQIREMKAHGMTFGAHSVDHPRYHLISLKEQLSQTRESLRWIREHNVGNQRVFSFPFTDDGVSKAFFEQIRGEVDATFGCAGIKDDVVSNHFQRLPMEVSGTAEQIVKTEYCYYWLRKRVGKHIIQRK